MELKKVEKAALVTGGLLLAGGFLTQIDFIATLLMGDMLGHPSFGSHLLAIPFVVGGFSILGVLFATRSF